MGFWNTVTFGLLDSRKNYREGVKYKNALVDLKDGKDIKAVMTTHGIHESHEAALKAGLDRLNKVEAKNAERTIKGLVREAERPNFWNRVGREGFGKTLVKSAGKTGLIVGATGAALAGLWYLSRSGKKKYDAREHAHDPLPDVMTPDMMPMGPADGRAQGEWQNRVMANRMGQQVGGPINPAQTVAEAQDLGAVPTR